MLDLKHMVSAIFGITTLVSLIVPCLAGEAVPVLLWDGSDSVESPPEAVNALKKASRVDFEKIIEKKLGGGQPPLLVFFRDSFCIEDLTKHKKDLAQLRDFGGFQYIPAVESPFSVLENLPYYNQSTVEELESVSEGQLVITKALDLDSIPETFKLIREANLIAVLTGRSCSFGRSERIRRAVGAGNDTEQLLVETERFLLYADRSPLLKTSGTEFKSLGKLKSATQEGEGTRDSPLKIKMTFDSSSELTVEISVKSGYYYFTKANVTDNGKVVELETRSDVVWPYKFSYHCLENITYFNKDEGVELKFENMQVQLDAKKFGDAYDCVGFTTIPIWSALFVTSILALIMIWGLIMIMDIRTMDRFDDPKGKTITISAQE